MLNIKVEKTSKVKFRKPSQWENFNLPLCQPRFLKAFLTLGDEEKSFISLTPGYR